MQIQYLSYSIFLLTDSKEWLNLKNTLSKQVEAVIGSSVEVELHLL